jgi:phosphatidylserine/phosphatidylglycerophosphate/cardiolipin synthase-like enzyme
MSVKYKCRRWFSIGRILLLLIVIIGFYHSFKSLPEGLSFEGEIRQVSEQDVEFLYDLTYADAQGKIHYEQNIFDHIFKAIDQAQRLIILDMFLWAAGKPDPYRNLGQELADHLVKKKKQNPDIKIAVITDGHNNNYNSFDIPSFQLLKENNIPVIFTDMNKMRDSNLVFSPLWRTLIQIFGEPGKGWIKTPFYPEKVSIRSILKMLNFKVNHRKVIMMDSGNRIHSYIISANPSGDSSRHSNVGILIKDSIYKDIYKAEKAVAWMSDSAIPELDFQFVRPGKGKGVEIQYLTERKIEKSMLDAIYHCHKGDRIRMTMFYFSDRHMVDSLIDASKRGVDIQLILDPSKYSFGMNVKGVPTRPMVDGLIKRSKGKIRVKFYNTHKEEFHSKMVFMEQKGKMITFIGSANLTRRNLDDLNLEADVKIVSDQKGRLARTINQYFQKLWNNEKGIQYVNESDHYGQVSWGRKLQYRVQEATGLCTF